MAVVQNSLRRVLGFGNALPSVFPSIYQSRLQQRVFSATSAVKKVNDTIPKFGPTSNPKLDALLAQIREDHFIAPYLSQEYFRLVSSPKNHPRLLSDPITIQLDGEPYTLKPKNNLRGAPRGRFIEALKLMEEPSDFEVLPELIRGYIQTNSAISRGTLVHITNKVIKSGNLDILMVIARSAKNTGFRFNRELARSFMHAIRGLQQKPGRGGVAKALRDASELLVIVGKRELSVEPDSPTRYSDDPIIVGIVLSMYADTSLRYNEGWHKEATKEMALRLKGVWEHIQWDPVLNEYDGKSSKSLAKSNFHNFQNLFKGYSATLEGMLQAKSVLAGSELSPWLETESERLAILITRLGDYIEKNGPLLMSTRTTKAQGETEERAGDTTEKATEGAEESTKEDVKVKLEARSTL